MRSASRQAGRWRPVVVALGVAVAAWSVSPPAIANEPTDVRVVSVTRGDDGAVTIVISVPMQQVGAASAPGGLTVVGADGSPVTPAVAALPPSATAVVVLLHTAGADPTTFQRANGAAAELLRSLDPAVARGHRGEHGRRRGALGDRPRRQPGRPGPPGAAAPVAFAGRPRCRRRPAGRPGLRRSAGRGDRRRAGGRSRRRPASRRAGPARAWAGASSRSPRRRRRWSTSSPSGSGSACPSAATPSPSWTTLSAW